MSPNRRRRRGRDDDYLLTNWKLRGAFVVFVVGIGVWEAIIFHWPVLLCVVVAVAVALLNIWWEVRRHEPRD
ncbi:MAG TPA: hypothetical protein VGF95_02845 [Solirubrobacteraceae bacterium]|jgi:Flp pilus assembly protein TadB